MMNFCVYDMRVIGLLSVCHMMSWLCHVVFVELSNGVHDMMSCLCLPRCRFISVSAIFGQTLYILFIGKVMPEFFMRV